MPLLPLRRDHTRLHDVEGVDGVRDGNRKPWAVFKYRADGRAWRACGLFCGWLVISYVADIRPLVGAAKVFIRQELTRALRAYPSLLALQDAEKPS